MAEIIKKLKAKGGVNYMLYFSDHGEDVFDTDTKKETDGNTQRFTVIAREHGKSVNK